MIWCREVKNLDPTARRPSMSGERSRDRLEEMYVLEEADWLRNREVVKKAIQERGLKVDAFVFDRERGSCVRLVEE
jgi:carbonic anhydrase